VSHDGEIAGAFARLYEAEQARDAAIGDLVLLDVIRSKVLDDRALAPIAAQRLDLHAAAIGEDQAYEVVGVGPATAARARVALVEAGGRSEDVRGGLAGQGPVRRH
jgi:hypothetical protein